MQKERNWGVSPQRYRPTGASLAGDVPGAIESNYTACPAVVARQVMAAWGRANWRRLTLGLAQLLVDEGCELRLVQRPHFGGGKLPVFE